MILLMSEINTVCVLTHYVATCVYLEVNSEKFWKDTLVIVSH